MPLLPGKENVGRNIKELVKAVHTRDQAIAIAMKMSRQQKKSKSSKRQ